MTITVAPDFSAVFVALGSFLTAVLPDGAEAVQAQGNRVPEPTTSRFVVMTPLRMPRLATNISDYADVLFEASIAPDGDAGLMTVTQVEFGTVELGRQVFGVDVEAGTTIVSLQSGAPGGVGVYVVSKPQALSLRAMAAGGQRITQKAQIGIQLDVHSDDLADAGNMAATIATLFRDPYGVETFHATSSEVTPLLAADPRQLPFINEAQQYESRWVVDVEIQANMTLQLPQEFAGALDGLMLISVEAKFPPS